MNPWGEALETAVKQAIWCAAKESFSAEEVFETMIRERGDLRKLLASIVVRSAQREMLWEDRPMG